MNDCLLVHVPKFQNRYRALGNYVSTQWMALGLFGMADAVDRAGHTIRILHLGLEHGLDPRFRLAGYLQRNPCRVAALSVHFHQQLHDSLRAAERIKEADGRTLVVLGGFTATFFAEELVRRFPAVDAVIAGEGERPLADLLARVKAGAGFEGVPNLVWRRDGAAMRNPERYVASAEDLDRMDFARLDLMEHAADYVRMPKIFSRLRVPARMRWRLSKVLDQKTRPVLFALCVGRGCVTNCSYCGGGINAHRQLSGRERVVFRSPERVMDDMRALARHGYAGAYVSFDPRPMADAYYPDLFRRMRAEGLRFGVSFSAWALPCRTFIEEFGRTFDRAWYVALSPETGSEALRATVRGMTFTNDELMETLRAAEGCGVRTLVYFSLGLPRETAADFDQTLRLRDRIRRECPRTVVVAFPIELEPAAPCHLDPGRYGLIAVRRELDDFLREQREPDYSSMTSLGYHAPTYQDQPVNGPREFARRVRQTKCRHFCDRRAVCGAASIVWKVADMTGLSAHGDEPL